MDYMKVKKKTEVPKEAKLEQVNQPLPLNKGAKDPAELERTKVNKPSSKKSEPIKKVEEVKTPVKSKKTDS